MNGSIDILTIHREGVGGNMWSSLTRRDARDDKAVAYRGHASSKLGARKRWTDERWALNELSMHEMNVHFEGVRTCMRCGEWKEVRGGWWHGVKVGGGERHGGRREGWREDGTGKRLGMGKSWFGWSGGHDGRLEVKQHNASPLSSSSSIPYVIMLSTSPPRVPFIQHSQPTSIPHWLAHIHMYLASATHLKLQSNENWMIMAEFYPMNYMWILK